MIVLRDKIFRRDQMPNDKFEFDPDLMREFNAIPEVEIETTKKYDRQLSTLSPEDRKKVKRFRKELEQGLFYGRPGDEEDTHFLSDFSKKDEHVVSKKINDEDRFSYRFRRPEIRELDDGSYVYHSKVVLDSCKGHELNGTPDYVKDRNYKNLKRNKNSNRNDT